MTPVTISDLFQQHPIRAVGPELWLCVFAFAVLLAGAFFSDKLQRGLLPPLAMGGVIVSLLSIANLWGSGLQFGPTGRAIFVADNFSLFFKFIFLFGLALTIIISPRFLEARGGDRHTVVGEYYGLLMLSTVGMMIVASAHDLLVVFLGIETLSIALYILAGFARTRLMSNEAALKYFLLGAFATGFLLYGIALTYVALGTTHIASIASAISAGTVKSPSILFVGVALILIGLAFKAALVPFHQWTPDVYEGSPTPVTAFMSIGAKAAALAALIRVLPGAFGGLSPQWHGMVMALAVLTMTAGNIIALSQNSIKRMLAYSSIAHAGYLLVGVLAAAGLARAGESSGAQNAIASVLVYMLAYAVMNGGAFAVLVWMESNARAGRDDNEETGPIAMDALNGLAARQPFVAASMTVFLMSLAGIPPTAGFLGKLGVFSSAIDAKLYGLVLIGVLNSVISVYYYLRPVAAMYVGEDKASAGEVSGVAGAGVSTVNVSAGGAAVLQPRSSAISLALVATIGLCAAIVLAMIVLQRTTLPLAQDAALSMMQTAR
ncbi:MAG TPA: NADH-quinone oxidoreductase subunit N [Abditibacteriaceae bacterium]|jgi:NADH-quinone oxidoreductase subunit N